MLEASPPALTTATYKEGAMAESAHITQPRISANPLALPEWAQSRIMPEPNSGCWLWTGTLRNGYGSFDMRHRGAGVLYAHRFVYETLVGPIPEGLQIDHLCRVRCCCN